MAIDEVLMEQNSFVTDRQTDGRTDRQNSGVAR